MKILDTCHALFQLHGDQEMMEIGKKTQIQTQTQTAMMEKLMHKITGIDSPEWTSNISKMATDMPTQESLMNKSVMFS